MSKRGMSQQLADDDAGLVSLAASEARRCRSSDVGDELEAIILAVRELQVDPRTPRGRRLVWQAWEQFVKSGLDYERWANCQKCGQSFRPEIDQRFAETLINRCCKPTRQWRVREHRFFNCPDCSASRR